ncbi:MAG TPA: DUF1800 domain-containing protein [Gemmatimonadales bacterium]
MLHPGFAAATAAVQTPRDSAFHALNRLGFGPAVGQLDSLARTGVMAWIEHQISVKGPQDSRLASREASFQVLSASRAEMVERFTILQRERAQARRDSSMAPGAVRRPAAGRGVREAGAELQQATLVRAALSRHQLAEVMADFWFNHFNVFLGKGLDRVLTPSYVEETIRPNALGRFEDLLLAVARSPAMLFYLDNVQSVAPGSKPPQLERLDRARGRGGRRLDPARRQRLDSLMQTAEQRRPTGLNENYARELLELHTLGVDGGYTQKDVTDVARILTGWGIAPPREGAGFQFHEWAHDRGEKTVLGVSFPSGKGEAEGVRLLRMLAAHPATMHHVSGKLCARFVSDLMPDGCTDAAVAAWKRSQGDIREVLRAIVRSPDFWAPATVGSKVKTPMEFLVSAVRAVAGQPDSTPRLAQQLVRLGQPLYLQAVPTGYPETQEDWVNSGALLTRMNVAVALAAGRMAGVTVDLDAITPLSSDRTALVERVNLALLGGRMSARTRDVILRETADLTDPAMARALAVGLALGGPEFQRQ